MAGTGITVDLAYGSVMIGTDMDTLVSIESALGSGGNDIMSGTAAANRLEGGLGDDRLDGRGDSDTLLGGAGADRLIGGLGNDVLQGDAGADRLYGDDGNDRLIGGTQADKLTGGAGGDPFVFLSPFDRPDQLLDFTAGEDKIEINLAGFGVVPGALLTAAAQANTWDVVWNGTARGSLIYDPASGWLSWDRTPTMADQTLHFATLPHSQLTTNDFVLV